MQQRPLHAEFGVCVTGIDLNELTRSNMAVVRDALDSRSVVHFRDQSLDDDAQLALTQALGTPEPNHVILGQEGRIEYFGYIGNVLDDGRQLGNDHKRTVFQTGNNMWHSDSSFREVPSLCSMNFAIEVPEVGGDTQFVSCRAAYDRLSPAVQDRIEPMVVVHDYVFSRSQVSPDAVTPSHAASLPPVPQKLVRRNPSNGKKNFYVGSHAKCINGVDEAEGRRLLDGLLEAATAEAHVYTHTWRPGDLVIWDNRCVLHRGTGYDADRCRRRMRQTRVQGVGSTLVEDDAYTA